ncbi:MAG: VCBS repeat-containing protein [Spirochaetales bacterium]|nr:VCBS repeat-containing protein [Spirochaetales bacterium]
MHRILGSVLVVMLLFCGRLSAPERAWQKLESLPDPMQILSWQEETPFVLKDHFLVTEGDLIIGEIKPQYRSRFLEIKRPNLDSLQAMGHLRPHGRIWAEKKIPVQITGFQRNESLMIEQGLRLWQSRLALQFIEQSAEQDFIVFQKGSSCFADQGKKNGPQYIVLASDCFEPGIITHLIGHALGLGHEHNRPDRDEYIALMDQEIPPVLQSFFSARPPGEPGRFNPHSIMLLGPEAFGQGRVTMKGRFFDLMRRPGPGGADFQRAGLLYGRGWYFLPAHLNREQQLDLIEIAAGKARAYLSRSGSLELSVSFGSAENLSPMHEEPLYLVCDCNGDGRSDLIEVHRQSQTASVWKGHEATFSLKSSYGAAQNLAPAAELAVYLCADVSGDGKSDLLEINRSRRHIRVFLATEHSLILDPQFRGAAAAGSLSDQLGYATGDFNGGGRFDILEINRTSRQASIFPGSQQGLLPPAAFARVYDLPPADATVHYRIADFNGDGKSDILEIEPQREALRLLRGSEGGFLTQRAGFPALNSPGAHYTTGDFNGDGLTDLLQIDAQSYAFFQGSATGMVSGPTGAWPAAAYMEVQYLSGDTNADGRAELIEINFSSDTLSTYSHGPDGFTLLSKIPYLLD